MKYGVIVAFVLLSFASCKKEHTNTEPAQVLLNVSYGTDAQQKLDLYLPVSRSTDSTPLVVLIHGGAWFAGDKSDFNQYIATIQQKLPSYAIANINYRLATVLSNYFPAQEMDVKSAITFLQQKSTEYKYRHQLAIIGASAGAHLAMLQAYKYNSIEVAAVADFFGPTDMAALYDSYDLVSQQAMAILLSGTPAANPAMYQQSSPLLFVSSQSAPTISFHGSADTLVPVAQTIALHNQLQAAGVPQQYTVYPNLGHDFWPMPTMEASFEKIRQFFQTYVH
jgi:acetyl esterase/lipase